jgi:hypothetical protein
MSQISPISAATTASQAVQASSANADAGNTTQAQSNLAQLGLPPVNLAKAASVNTLNAELVSSQFGIDPASVSGVFGGAAASSGSLFANDNLLPLLQSLSSATAAQALALIGVQTPTPGSASNAASATSTAAASTSQAASQAYLDQAASTSDSTPKVVDPLWGVQA